MRREDDHERWISKNLERGGHDLFEHTFPKSSGKLFQIRIIFLLYTRPKFTFASHLPVLVSMCSSDCHYEKLNYFLRGCVFLWYIIILSYIFHPLSANSLLCSSSRSWATGWMIGGSNPDTGWGFFSSPPRSDRFWGSFSLLSSRLGSLSLEIKWPGRESDHSPPSSAEVKNAWSYTSTSQHAIKAWC
jgi:hypothetical protein